MKVYSKKVLFIEIFTNPNNGALASFEVRDNAGVWVMHDMDTPDTEDKLPQLTIRQEDIRLVSSTEHQNGVAVVVISRNGEKLVMKNIFAEDREWYELPQSSEANVYRDLPPGIDF